MRRWAVLTVLLYGCTLALLAAPAMLIYGVEHNAQSSWHSTVSLKDLREFYSHWLFWLWLGVMVAGQALLLLVPLEKVRERPTQRRRLWIPVATGAFFFANLALAGLVSLLCALFGDDGLSIIGGPAELSHELVESLPPIKAAFVRAGIQPDETLFAIFTWLGMVAVLWGIWGMVFYRYARTDDPDALMKRVTGWLLRGSALELLVAVPSHIIVRQRHDCCAPISTFWGISLGISVMLLSFGPGVFFLFADRMRQLKPRQSR